MGRGLAFHLGLQHAELGLLREHRRRLQFVEIKQGVKTQGPWLCVPGCLSLIEVNLTGRTTESTKAHLKCHKIPISGDGKAYKDAAETDKGNRSIKGVCIVLGWGEGAL